MEQRCITFSPVTIHSPYAGSHGRSQNNRNRSLRWLNESDTNEFESSRGSCILTGLYYKPRMRFKKKQANMDFLFIKTFKPRCAVALLTAFVLFSSESSSQTPAASFRAA